MNQLKYLVTGTGRCGTVYMSHLLTSLDIPCGHESVFTHSDIPEAIKRLTHNSPVNSEISNTHVDQISAESSYLAAPYLNHEILSNTTIIHITRHPLLVINSYVFDFRYFTSNNPETLDEDMVPGIPWQLFIYKHLPTLRNPTLTTFERAAKFYIEWNTMIEKNSSNNNYVRQQIESQPDSLCKYLHLSIPEDITKIAKNSYPNNPGLVDFIPEGKTKRELIQISKKYGYSW